jgi:hypothetical protein
MVFLTPARGTVKINVSPNEMPCATFQHTLLDKEHTHTDTHTHTHTHTHISCKLECHARLFDTNWVGGWGGGGEFEFQRIALTCASFPHKLWDTEDKRQTNLNDMRCFLTHDPMRYSGLPQIPQKTGVGSFQFTTTDERTYINNRVNHNNFVSRF